MGCEFYSARNRRFRRDFSDQWMSAIFRGGNDGRHKFSYGFDIRIAWNSWGLRTLRDPFPEIFLRVSRKTAN